MRASNSALSGKISSSHETHISGAEGIYSEKDIQKITAQYIQRAYNHPRGRPDKINITIEKISQKPRNISILPITTVECSTLEGSEDLIYSLLKCNDVSDKAIMSALKIVKGKESMRGAALILADSGRRADPDRQRGIRVSRLGITETADKQLSKYLGTWKLSTTTVKEAVILASKVASCNDIIAELCISDDPDYTTGYIASRKSGYTRIPNIKKPGDKSGGRVFFLKETADIATTIFYLEKRPVLIAKITDICAEG